MAAMESTGPYWKPLYNILEMEGLPAMVVNAAHMKALPAGRPMWRTQPGWLTCCSTVCSAPASSPTTKQRELREDDPLSQEQGGGASARGEPAPEDTGRREHQAGQFVV